MKTRNSFTLCLSFVMNIVELSQDFASARSSLDVCTQTEFVSVVKNSLYGNKRHYNPSLPRIIYTVSVFP